MREEAIREIRERASLVEVVSDVVALRRRGRSAIGLCPFHAEKTPSFNVSEDRASSTASAAGSTVTSSRS